MIDNFAKRLNEIRKKKNINTSTDQSLFNACINIGQAYKNKNKRPNWNDFDESSFHQSYKDNILSSFDDKIINALIELLCVCDQYGIRIEKHIKYKTRFFKKKK